MITWIQVLLQKHHKVIFSILLVVIIVAFVFTIGSSIPFFGDSAPTARVTRRDFYGYNLDNQAQMRELQEQAILEIRLNGETPTQQSLQGTMLKQAFLQALAREMSVFKVSDDEFKAYIQSRPVFKNKDGSFNEQAWSTFVSEFEKQNSLGREALNRLLVQNALVDRMQNLVQGPGFVLDEEINQAYSDAYGLWNLAIAKLEYAKFDPAIDATEQQLKDFYEANKENFRVPAAVAVDVAFIPAEKVENANFSDSEIESHYRSTMVKYLSYVDNKPVIAELKDVKDKVAEDLKKVLGVKSALTKADEIVTNIYDADAKFASEEFKKIISDAKLELKSLPLVRPTDKEQPKGVPAKLMQLAFKLNEENFYADPVEADDGAWLVFFRESKPSFIPDFESIKQAVTDAYKAQERAKMFSEKGQALSKKLAEAVKQGGLNSFKETAKADGFETSEIEKFSFANEAFQNQAMFATLDVLSNVLPKMKAGGVSDMITVGGAGYIVYAISFDVPKSDAQSKELKEIAERAKLYLRNISASTVISNAIDVALPKEQEQQ